MLYAKKTKKQNKTHPVPQKSQYGLGHSDLLYNGWGKLVSQAHGTSRIQTSTGCAV